MATRTSGGMESVSRFRDQRISGHQSRVLDARQTPQEFFMVSNTWSSVHCHGTPVRPDAQEAASEETSSGMRISKMAPPAD